MEWEITNDHFTKKAKIPSWDMLEEKQKESWIYVACSIGAFILSEAGSVI